MTLSSSDNNGIDYSELLNILEEQITGDDEPTNGMNLTIAEACRLAIYRRDPVLFVERELGESPSDYQKEVLRDVGDRSKKNFIISAGRGSGKTILVSWIVAWSIACLQDIYKKYECIILGGSQDQSDIMYNYFKSYIFRTPLLEKRLIGEPKQRKTDFEHGYVRAVACSDTSVRGRHPELLILDEVAGADDEVVLAAIPMVAAGAHGRTIMLSTPHRFYGVFQDNWDNAGAYGFNKYGPWSLEHLQWIDQDVVERARLSYPPEKFAVEFLGEFPHVGGLVFHIEDIEDAVADKPFTLNYNYDCDAGVDWGKTNPTVMVRSQSIKSKIYIPGPPMEWQYVKYPIVNAEITAYCKKHRVDQLWADASHEGENQRLTDNGIRAESIFFSKDKQKMIELAQMLFHMKKLIISPDQETLIKQLKKYRWKEKKEGAKDTTRVKKDEDHVDALILSLYSLIDTGWFDEQQDGFLTM